MTSRRRAATVRRLERSTGTLATAASRAHGERAPLVRRDVGRRPLLGQPRRAGRHRRLRPVVPRPRGRAGHHRRRVRHRPARARARRLPAADRRPRAHDHRGGRGARRRAGRRGGRRLAARGRCCSTPARSPSPRPRSTRARPRRAAPGTRGSSRWCSTRCCATTSTTPSCRAARRWAGGSSPGVCVVTGHAPDGDPEMVAEAVKRSARHHGHDAITGVQAQRLVVVLGNVTDPVRATRGVLAHFARGSGGGGVARAGAGRRARAARASRWPASARRRRGRTRRGPSRRTTCCPSARSTATPTRSACSSTRCTSRCRPRTRR